MLFYLTKPADRTWQKVNTISFIEVMSIKGMLRNEIQVRRTFSCLHAVKLYVLKKGANKRLFRRCLECINKFCDLLLATVNHTFPIAAICCGYVLWSTM